MMQRIYGKEELLSMVVRFERILQGFARDIRHTYSDFEKTMQTDSVVEGFDFAGVYTEFNNQLRAAFNVVDQAYTYIYADVVNMFGGAAIQLAPDFHVGMPSCLRGWQAYRVAGKDFISPLYDVVTPTPLSLDLDHIFAAGDSLVIFGQSFSPSDNYKIFTVDTPFTAILKLNETFLTDPGALPGVQANGMHVIRIVEA
jgi:hypothetical protein